MNYITLSGRIGFHCGLMKGLTKDFQDLAPSILPSVPRVLNRLFNECTNTAKKRGFGNLQFLSLS